MTVDDAYLALLTEQIDLELERIMQVDHPLRSDEAAMYSLLAGGKRVRPLLLILTAKMCGAEELDVLPFAVALEMIHTYSLIHDDLPAMDDDDLRRGKASCHKAYDEAAAILAGDLLLNLAYETMFDAILANPERRRIEAAHQIAEAAGRGGMIAGQAMDLFGGIDRSDEQSAVNFLTALQIKKTGALIEAAVIAGALLGKAEDAWFGPLCLFARALGRAFQLQDDLLDLTGSEKLLGKSTGKDVRDDKLTFVTLLGEARASEKLADQLSEMEKSLNQLESIGADTNCLRSLVSTLIGRRA